MIITARTGDLRWIGDDEDIAVKLIVNNQPNAKTPNGVFEATQLMPQEAVSQIRDGILQQERESQAAAGTLWTQRAFDRKFAPAYMQQLRSNPEALTLLQQIAQKAASSNVLIASPEADENKSIRALVAGALQMFGAEVMSRGRGGRLRHADYSKHAELMAKGLTVKAVIVAPSDDKTYATKPERIAMDIAKRIARQLQRDGTATAEMLLAANDPASEQLARLTGDVLQTRYHANAIYTTYVTGDETTQPTGNVKDLSGERNAYGTPQERNLRRDQLMVRDADFIYACVNKDDGPFDSRGKIIDGLAKQRTGVARCTCNMVATGVATPEPRKTVAKQAEAEGRGQEAQPTM